MVSKREITIYQDGCNVHSNNPIILLYRLKNGIVINFLGNDMDDFIDDLMGKIEDIYESELITFIMESPHIDKNCINIDKTIEGYIKLITGFSTEDFPYEDEDEDETQWELTKDVMNFYEVDKIKTIYKGKETNFGGGDEKCEEGTYMPFSSTFTHSFSDFLDDDAMFGTNEYE